MTPTVTNSHNEALEVIFMNVQHGNCTIIVSPSQHLIAMVDCKFGAGPKIVRYLRYNDLDAPSIVFISHLHDDHVAGFADIFRHLINHNVDVKRIYTNYVGHTSQKRADSGGQAVVDQLRDLLDDDQSRLVEFTNATPPYSIDGLKFTVLQPDRFDLHRNHDRDDMLNDLSGVLKIDYGKSSILLPGDIEGWGVSKLLRTTPKEIISNSLLLFPHHGAGWNSLTSKGQKMQKLGEAIVSPDVFIHAVSSMWTVLSVGTNNDGNWEAWKHPSISILDLLSQWHNQNKGDFICTEATPHCCPNMSEESASVPCGDHVKFKLFRNGKIELIEPNYKQWQNKVRAWQDPKCKFSSNL